MDLIYVSKLKAIGIKISFGDEEGPVVIRRWTTNEICCNEIEVSELFWVTVEYFLNLLPWDIRSMEEEMSRRDARLCYDLRCEDYKIFRHKTRGNYYDFLKEVFDMDAPVDEQTCRWNYQMLFEMERSSPSMSAPWSVCCQT